MTKKLVVALAICLAGWFSPSTAHAQFWTATGISTGEGVPVAVVNRPAVKFGGLRDQIDIYSIGNDRSISVSGIHYGCRRHGCDYFLSPVQNLGGVSGYFPSAIGWGNHREVFIWGSDAKLWHNWSDDNINWSGWYSLGGPAGSWPTGGFCSAPGAVSWAPGRIDVFQESCGDRRLWHIWYDGGWSNWEITPTSGPIFGFTQPVSSGPGKLDIVVGDDSLSLNVIDVQYDGHWASHYTGLSAKCGWPAVTTQATGVAAFVGACDYATLLGAAYYDGQWNAVQSVPASRFDSLVAVQSGSIAHVIYADLSGVGYLHSQNWFNTYFASGFGYVPEWIGTSVNDTFAFALTAVPSVDGPPGYNPPVYVFAQKPDHSIWYTYLLH